MGESFGIRLLGGQRFELRYRFVKFALLRQTPRLRKCRIGRYDLLGFRSLDLLRRLAALRLARNCAAKKQETHQENPTENCGKTKRIARTGIPNAPKRRPCVP